MVIIVGKIFFNDIMFEDLLYLIEFNNVNLIEKILDKYFLELG